MRITEEQAQFFKRKIKAILPLANIYLFGSRTDQGRKGGDIDILVIGERRLSGQEKRDIKIAFYRRFGEQQVDIISYGPNEISDFQNLMLEEAVEL